MKLLFHKLEWQQYKTVDGTEKIAELDHYADMKLSNGIFVRVTMGEMAQTNHPNPYEMYVEEPAKRGLHIPFLTASKVNFILNELDNRVIE